jgi:non-canonical poly(A) RNA polymerase PAPD5/7
MFLKCEVVVFGSQATGLCLPSSDIDIVIQFKEDASRKTDESSSSNNKSNTTTQNDGEDNEEEEWKSMREKSPLEQLAEALRNEWEYRDDITYLEVISKTKVPLVKFTLAPSNTSVDVSFMKDSGPQAATLIKTYMDAMPPLRPLIFVLKYFLAARVLNEPYSGGVGSFMLQLMIVSFLQHRERYAYNFGKPGLYNLGCLLVEFFEMYGTRFNYCTTGISVRHDGAFFRKGERKEHFVVPSRPFMLAIENPLEITADVGRASFRMQIVQRAFAAAYKVLLAHVASPVEPVVSILATIIPPTEEMVKRKMAKVSSLPCRPPLSTDRQSSPSETSPRRKKRRFK